MTKSMAATDILNQKRMWKPATLPNKCELIYERLESKMELQNIDGVILKPCTIEQKMACFLDGGYALVCIWYTLCLFVSIRSLKKQKQNFCHFICINLIILVLRVIFRLAAILIIQIKNHIREIVLEENNRLSFN